MLNIVGDINLTDTAFDVGIGIGSQIAKGENPFMKINRDDKDLWIGNFEGVSSNQSDRSGFSTKIFNLPPQYLLNFHQFNIYNIANNHTMEHGPSAFHQTVENLKSCGVKIFGLANSPSAEFEHKGKKCSITGFSQRMEASGLQPLYWYNPDLNDIKKEFDKICSNHLKIIYVHWGNEFVDRPYNDQRIFAHALIDMGFDLVIGMHPHLLQGFEVYNGKRIYYSIGNFVFNMGWEPLRYGAIVHIDWDNDELNVSESYIKIESDNFPIIISKERIPYQYSFTYLNSLIKFDMNNEEYYSLLSRRLKKFHKYNRRYIIKSFLKMNPKDSFYIIKDFFSRRF